MRWLDNMSNAIKKGIRSWLQIQPSNPYSIQINETMDFELCAIRNRIWYRGDSNELEQLYGQVQEYADKHKFWASKCTPGMDMRKIHTGLPGMIVRILTSIVVADMNDFEFDSPACENVWKEIEKKNKFRKKLERSLKEVLYIGDGAWKITINTSKSDYPILRWYPGERIEIVNDGDELQEVIFKTPYDYNHQKYVLHEHYGYGYIHNELYLGENLVDFKTFEPLKGMSDFSFDEGLMLAVPMNVYESAKFEGRGGSIYDGKLDNFDAFDEAWSQWMDALRAGRAKTYIPDCLVPKDPSTGQTLRPNPFDCRYFAGDNIMGEKVENKITTDQPVIPHDSYIATYTAALDQCLQGIISPSTLGIDTKKLDNADAQREKEKATLYTRNAMVDALQEQLPELISACINAYNVLMKQPVEEIKVDIPFGEYANPSFESQVETVSKAKTGGIMSVEAVVEELYGDTRDEEWKKEEILRLKAEQGITDETEPAVNLSAGGFQIDTTGGQGDAGNGNEPGIQNGVPGVPGVAAVGK